MLLTASKRAGKEETKGDIDRPANPPERKKIKFPSPRKNQCNEQSINKPPQSTRNQQTLNPTN
jgi:hypothetical protein